MVRSHVRVLGPTWATEHKFTKIAQTWFVQINGNYVLPGVHNYAMYATSSSFHLSYM